MAKITVSKDKNFSIVSNAVLRDTELSVKARFILIFCLSLSDSWEYSVKGLARVIGVGTEAVSSGLKELEVCGYLTRQRVRDESGRLKSTEYVLHEKPRHEKPVQEKPVQEKPRQEKPRQEKPAQEKPAQEKPAQEKPAQEKPVQEKPRQEKPVQEKPAQINIDLKKYQENKNGLKEVSKGEGKVPCEEIVRLYNEICVSLPPVRVVTQGRVGAMRGRWVACGGDLDVFVRLFRMAQESAFLTGDNRRGWKASFDWLLRLGNMTKVLEGNYAGGSRDGSLVDTAAEVARQMESEGW